MVYIWRNKSYKQTDYWISLWVFTFNFVLSNFICEGEKIQTLKKKSGILRRDFRFWAQIHQSPTFLYCGIIIEKGTITFHSSIDVLPPSICTIPLQHKNTNAAGGPFTYKIARICLINLEGRPWCKFPPLRPALRKNNIATLDKILTSHFNRWHI